MKKQKLSHGLRKYIRRQKMVIKRMAKDEKEERGLVRALLGQFYKHA